MKEAHTIVLKVYKPAECQILSNAFHREALLFKL